MKNAYVARLHLLAIVIVIVIVSASATTLRAQTYTDLYNLGTASDDPTDPAWIGLFAQGRDGNLYSTAQTGGTFSDGTAFQLTLAGKITPWSFDGKGTDGIYPYSGLTLGTDGNFYGTTYEGGSSGAGTVFKVTSSGKITTLYSFGGFNCCAYAAPIQGLDGNYYGTTSDGGGEVFGTVYKMTPSGKLTVIYTFPGSSKLAYPMALTLGTDGNFYGTALGGGANHFGGVFKITPHGKLTVLYSFGGTPDGETPKGTIIQATDGNFYGTTEKGGVNGYGSIYKMTPAGALTIIHSFNEDGFGLQPLAGLVQATDGKFYGASASLGGFGVIFQITSSGTYAVLVSLTNVAGKFPGANPQVSLFQIGRAHV